MRGQHIRSTHTHDAGAFGQCHMCRRYSDNPDCMSLGFVCDCGASYGYVGNFRRPTANSKWRGEETPPANPLPADVLALVGTTVRSNGNVFSKRVVFDTLYGFDAWLHGLMCAGTKVNLENVDEDELRNYCTAN